MTRLVSAFLIATLMAGCAATVSAPALPGLHAEIRAALDAMEQAFREGDLGGVAAHYADDALLLSPGGERVTGREAIDAYWARFENPVDWSLSLERLEGEAGLLVHRGRSRLVRLRDGVEQVSTVEYVLIWRRDERGALRIAVDGYW
jgi:ketosteroid isomerase-like protein